VSVRKAEIVGLAVLLFAVWLIPGPPVYADTPENDYAFAEALLNRAVRATNDEYLPLAREVAETLYGDRSASKNLRGGAAQLLVRIYDIWHQMTGEEKFEKKMEEWRKKVIDLGGFPAELVKLDKLFGKLEDANQKIADALDKETTGDKKAAKKLRAEAKELILKTQKEFEPVVKSFRAAVDRLLPKDPPRGWRPNREQGEAMFKRNLAELHYARSFLLLARSIDAIDNMADKRKALADAEKLFLLYIEGSEEMERHKPMEEFKKEGMSGGDAREGQFPVLDGHVKILLGETYLELALLDEEDATEKFEEAIAYFDEVSWFTTNEPMSDKMEKLVQNLNMQAYFRKAQAYNLQDDPDNAKRVIDEMLNVRKHKVCPKCNLWIDDKDQVECGGYVVDSGGNPRWCKADLRSTLMKPMFPMELVRESLYGKQALFEQAAAYVATGEYVEGVRIAFEIYEAEYDKRDADTREGAIEIEAAKRMAKMSLKTQAVFPAKISFAIAKGFFYLDDERRSAMAFKDVVSAAVTEDEERKYAAPALFELGKTYYHQELFLLAYTAFIELATNHSQDENAATAAQLAETCISKLSKGEGSKTDPEGNPIQRKRGDEPEKLTTAHMKDLERTASDLFGKLGQGVAAQRKVYSEAQLIQIAAAKLQKKMREQDAKRKAIKDEKERADADKAYAVLARNTRDKFLEAAKAYLKVVEVAEEKRGEVENKTPVPFYPNSRQDAGYCRMQAAQTHDERTEAKERAKLLAESVKLFGTAIDKAKAQKKLGKASDEERRQLTIVRAHLYLGMTHLDASWPATARKAHIEAAVNALVYFDSDEPPDLEKVVGYIAQARLQQLYAYFPLERFDDVEAVFAKIKRSYETNRKIYSQFARISAWWLGENYIAYGEELVKANKEAEGKKFLVKAADFLDDWRKISEAEKPLTDSQKLFVADMQSKAGRPELVLKTVDSVLKAIEYEDPKTPEQKKSLYRQAKLVRACCLYNMKRYLEAAEEYEWFREKKTPWQDKLEVVEGIAKSYWNAYLVSKKEKKKNQEALGKAQKAYQDLYRKTPATGEKENGEPDETLKKLAIRHWEFYYQLFKIFYEKQDYKYIVDVLGEFIKPGVGDLDELMERKLVSEALKEKLIKIHKRAFDRTSKKKKGNK